MRNYGHGDTTENFELLPNESGLLFSHYGGMVAYFFRLQESLLNQISGHGFTKQRKLLRAYKFTIKVQHGHL
ncbi:hypothetical protein [Cylindrospermopsis sp. CR12]|uniref:hypothetical protein n=1 Tax=Cylindrospermopsis TaxID=77021 RepID=UPI00128EB2F0|nr:hypothetical protein [Cylindrospermopsis sp. CR12]